MSEHLATPAPPSPSPPQPRSFSPHFDSVSISNSDSASAAGPPTNLEQLHSDADATRGAGDSHDHEVNMGGGEREGEVESTHMAEQTLVEEENVKGHKSGPSTSSLSLVKEGDIPKEEQKARIQHSANANATATTPTTPTTWDPLKHSEDGDRTLHGQERTIIVEEGDDVVDSNGKLIYPDEEEEEDEDEEQRRVQRRPSHLRLDLKPTTPMPWEEVEPPLDNNSKGYYSPVASHKFRTLQNSGASRPMIPKSSYYFGPPPPESAYGTAPVGQIGVHHPREILRVERDYTGGEVIQFAPIYPLELEGRITPTRFLESINAINEILISAHSLRHSFFDNLLAILSLQVSRLFVKTHFERELMRLKKLIERLNADVYNPVGLNIVWPHPVAFLYLEIEYY